MHPLNDDELQDLLRQWQAPAAPSRMKPPTRKPNVLHWLVSGSLRVPVPIGVCALLVLLFLAMQVLRERVAPAATLGDFQPVKQLQPRVLRNIYDAR